MIAQHNYSGQIIRAVQMRGSFVFGGKTQSAGSVILFWPFGRTLMPAHIFSEAFTVLPIGADGTVDDREFDAALDAAAS